MKFFLKNSKPWAFLKDKYYGFSHISLKEYFIEWYSTEFDPRAFNFPYLGQ